MEPHIPYLLRAGSKETDGSKPIERRWVQEIEPKGYLHSRFLHCIPRERSAKMGRESNKQSARG
jgi:hypothetical protein